jgi:polysaccharide pyruvyl transferase WcaK-like protein
MLQDFDENWYVTHYPDVGRAVAAGKFASPLSHYTTHGQQEGRSPTAPADSQPRTFALGAYGTNNVGDEAIFDGVLTRYPRCIQLYLNFPRHAEGQDVYHLLSGPNPFRSEDHLIIGGGGLLYHRDAIQTLVDVARRVRAVGGRVDILRIGCEAAHRDYYDVIRELVGLADTVTVRTTISQEVLESIVGNRSTVEPDFAFLLQGTVGQSTTPSTTTTPLIGLVTSGDPREERQELVRILREQTGPSAPGGRVRFVHIPHSKAYLSPLNNDCLVGESLWSSIDIFSHSRTLFFSTGQFTNDPTTVLKTYQSLDGVMSARFHGLIFAKLFKIPTLLTSGSTLKNQSFARDFGDKNLFVSKSNSDLRETYEAFIQHVRRRKASGS